MPTVPDPPPDRRRLPLSLSLALFGAAPLGAQEPARSATRPGVPQDPDAVEVVAVDEYDPRRSWALFAACDQNADDRLDLFEASRGLVEIDDPRNSATFRLVDSNSDGFVQWPEFDHHYRAVVRLGGTLRIRPKRPIVVPPDPTAPEADSGPVSQLLRTFDEDGDGGLGADEYPAFLRRAQLEAEPGARFAALDTDRSGVLSPNEFESALALVPALRGVIQPNRRARELLPPSYRAADRNLDGVLDRDELEAALRRTHPSLARWTDQILLGADLNGNGTLGAPEILRVTRTRAQGARQRRSPR